jgi:putative addiction module component (TIGR02574 family)
VNATLRQTVQELSIEDQLELLDFLWEQVLGPKQVMTPLPESERLELLKRLERMQTNPRSGTPWREFIGKNGLS